MNDSRFCSDVRFSRRVELRRRLRAGCRRQSRSRRDLHMTPAARVGPCGRRPRCTRIAGPGDFQLPRSSQCSSERNHQAPPAQRIVGGLEHVYDAGTVDAVSVGRLAALDAVDEMLALAKQRLLFLDARNLDVAVAIRELELAESIVVL